MLIDFRKKTRGAISIFLVIILVPMLTMSSLFVDASKVSLAKAVATSAGDLALNTALTNYDTQLKDMYGLFATAQDMDDLFSKLEDYYYTSITSSGVSDEEATEYVDQIMAQLGLVAESSDTADILNMELIDFSVAKRDDATLANATVLEKQIVDFMKYRAPVNTGLSFITSLQTFTTLSEQTTLVDNRQNYYKEEQNVMQTLQNAWKHINEYNKSPIVTNPSYFSNMQTNLNSYEPEYRAINKKTIMDLYDTQDYVNYHFYVRKESATEKSASGATTGVDIWKISSNVYGSNFPSYIDKYGSYSAESVDTLPSANQIKGLMDNFWTASNSMDSKKLDVTGFVPNGIADVYELQYLVQLERSGKLGAFSSSASSVYTTYQSIRNAMIWVEGYDLIEEPEEEETSEGESTESTESTPPPKITASDVKNQQFNINSNYVSLSKHYELITEKYESQMAIFKQYADLFTGYANTYGGLTDETDTNTKANTMGTTAAKYVTDLEAAAKELDDAVTDLQTAKTSVSAGGALDSAKTTWKSSAEVDTIKNTSLAKQDLAEIDQLGSYLNADEMQKLIDRLQNISTNLKATATQVKNYKFDDTFIGDIQSYLSLKAVVGNYNGDSKLKKVSLSEAQLTTDAENWIKWENGDVKIDWIDDSGTQIKLYGANTDKLNFYTYLYSHFNTGDVDSGSTEEKTPDKENGENVYNNVKSKSSESAEKEASTSGNTSSSNEINSKSNLPSKGNSGETPSASVSTGDSAAKDTSASLGSMFSGGLGTAIMNAAADLRDKIYVSDYVMSMFSYDTIENEYKVEYKEKNGSAPTEIKLQTLTLQDINATNNYAYGREVEYIIYGGSNAGNITKAYGSIYGIRFAFNLIYAFSDSSIRDTAFAVATPISAATMGIIPVPLIQAAIIIGIACCESGIDLGLLKSGESVPLFKTKDTWYCSINGVINAAKGLAADAIEQVAEYAVDQSIAKLNEVLDMTDEELTKQINEKSGDVEKYVGDAYDTLITQHANTAIQKLTTLATNAIEEATMDPNLNPVEYVNAGLDDWLAQEKDISDPSSIGYIVKEEAVNVIKGSFVQPMIDAITEGKNQVTGSIDEMGKKITDQIATIRTQIIGQVTMVSDKVIEYKDTMMKNVKSSMANGAEELKKTLNKEISGIFGSGGVDMDSLKSNSSNKDNSGIASLISFTYSDYLRLFLLIGLYTNEEAIMLRTADVIQVNMAHQTGEENYVLSQSAVYVEVSAEVQVKPTLLALPLFTDVENNPVDEVNWYTVNYNDIRGY